MRLRFIKSNVILRLINLIKVFGASLLAFSLAYPVWASILCELTNLITFNKGDVTQELPVTKFFEPTTIIIIGLALFFLCTCPLFIFLFLKKHKMRLRTTPEYIFTGIQFGVCSIFLALVCLAVLTLFEFLPHIHLSYRNLFNELTGIVWANIALLIVGLPFYILFGFMGGVFAWVWQKVYVQGQSFEPEIL